MVASRRRAPAAPARKPIAFENPIRKSDCFEKSNNIIRSYTHVVLRSLLKNCRPKSKGLGEVAKQPQAAAEPFWPANSHDWPAALCRPVDVTSTTTQSRITRAAPIDWSVSLPPPPLPPPAEWPRLRHQPAKHSTSCSAWTTVPARTVSTRRSCVSHGCDECNSRGQNMHASMFPTNAAAAYRRPVRPTQPHRRSTTRTRGGTRRSSSS